MLENLIVVPGSIVYMRKRFGGVETVGYWFYLNYLIGTRKRNYGSWIQGWIPYIIYKDTPLKIKAEVKLLLVYCTNE